MKNVQDQQKITKINGMKPKAKSKTRSKIQNGQTKKICKTRIRQKTLGWKRSRDRAGGTERKNGRVLHRVLRSAAKTLYISLALLLFLNPGESSILLLVPFWIAMRNFCSSFSNFLKFLSLFFYFWSLIFFFILSLSRALSKFKNFCRLPLADLGSVWNLNWIFVSVINVFSDYCAGDSCSCRSPAEWSGAVGDCSISILRGARASRQARHPLIA